jgi:hypothetical protein
LALFCPLLPPISNTFLTLSPPSPFLPSSDLSPVYQYTLYHAPKHHHSPPEITSSLSLSYSPDTSHYLICLPYYLSHVCLVRGSLVLLSFTFLLSLVEHHHFRLAHILSQAPHPFFHFLLTLCHNYQVVCKRQAPNFLPTHHTPPGCGFFNISSISATYIVNSRTLSGEPCLTPFVVSNHLPSFSPTFTLFLVLTYISSIFRTSHSLIPLSLSYTQRFSQTLSNAAMKSANNILPPFFFNSFLVKWSRMYTLSIVPLPFLKPV